MKMEVPISIIIATVFSCIGNTFTLLTYILFPELRNPSQVFALWLAIGSYGEHAIHVTPLLSDDITGANRILDIYICTDMLYE